MADSMATTISTSSFNPRPRTGGDEIYQKAIANGLLFQSTPPHGRRPRSRSRYDLGEFVSIHAPAREATVITG